jgi:hypothetical protein
LERLWKSREWKEQETSTPIMP